MWLVGLGRQYAMRHTRVHTHTLVLHSIRIRHGLHECNRIIEFVQWDE